MSSFASKTSRVLEKPGHGRHGPGPSVPLGVKGRLSNQEMESLKQQLAQATAYDHIPDTQRAKRRAKAAAAHKPMTRVYHVVETRPEQSPSLHRPSRKTLASIEYEKRFTERSYDSVNIRPARKGITEAAKTILQEEFVTQPREISSIPQSLLGKQSSSISNQSSDTNGSAQVIKTGKRGAPAAIPQVFIL